MAAPFRLTLGESLLRAIIGVRQVIDAGEHGAEEFAVGDHAADTDAAEIHAMIAALAPDEAGARGFTLGTVISERDLERCVGGFRTRIAEERIVQIAGRQIGEARGEFEHLGMAELESGGEIELGRLFLDRFDDPGATVAGIGAPKARRRIEHRAAGHVVIMHVLGAGDEARLLLESAIGGEAHPERFEIVR